TPANSTLSLHDALPISEDEDPESVSNDGTGRCQATAVPLQGVGRQPINRDDAHATPRRPDRARSIRAISAAGIAASRASFQPNRSEEHTSELQSLAYLV